MAGCIIPCVEVNKYGPSAPDNLDLCRRKWNYVRSLFVGGYLINTSGVWVDCLPTIVDCYNRPSDNPGKIADIALYDEMFDIDYDFWYQHHKSTPFERFLEWRYRYGTTALNNLPQHKRQTHIGHCWAPCPYSTQSPELRTRHMLGLSNTDPLPSRVDHTDSLTDKVWYMSTGNNGSAWGYRCEYPGCPHYLESGQYYFYT